MSRGAAPAPPPVPRGTRVVVDAERVAHGGHVVARHEGRVVFVRHALPGETVEVEITGEGKGGRFLRGDAVRAVPPSPDRVEAPCPHARPGGCGGCDWQLASPASQRRLKAEVLREQLSRLGGLDEIGGVPLDEAVDVVAVPGDRDGLAWRTRVRYAVDADGAAGFHRHRSGRVETVERCPLVTDELDGIGVTRQRWPGTDAVTTVASSGGDRSVVVEPASLGRSLPRDVNVPGLRGRGWVRELAGGREWRVSADGFWQVHPGAADTLVDAVRTALDPQPGEHLLDLYSGVGLFAGCLAPALGEDGQVDAVEASARACADARRNLHDLPGVRIHERAVASWLRWTELDSVDLVVLDPPRSGAGAEVLGRVLDLSPRAVAYVACDAAVRGRGLGLVRWAVWRVACGRGVVEE